MYHVHFSEDSTAWTASAEQPHSAITASSTMSRHAQVFVKHTEHTSNNKQTPIVIPTVGYALRATPQPHHYTFPHSPSSPCRTCSHHTHCVHHRNSHHGKPTHPPQTYTSEEPFGTAAALTAFRSLFATFERTLRKAQNARHGLRNELAQVRAELDAEHRRRVALEGKLDILGEVLMRLEEENQDLRWRVLYPGGGEMEVGKVGAETPVFTPMDVPHERLEGDLRDEEGIAVEDHAEEILEGPTADDHTGEVVEFKARQPGGTVKRCKRKTSHRNMTPRRVFFVMRQPPEPPVSEQEQDTDVSKPGTPNEENDRNSNSAADTQPGKNSHTDVTIANGSDTPTHTAIKDLHGAPGVDDSLKGLLELCISQLKGAENCLRFVADYGGAGSNRSDNQM
ncbi:hypothetical protein BJ742DRAFT_838601 [Cladochytrium replicatum]|nr:hypothetical protein BJ742DRAFT_838601 [Cladochytrium replicatum]